MHTKLLISAAAIALVATVSVASADEQAPIPTPPQFTTIGTVPAIAMSDTDAGGTRGAFTVTTPMGNEHGGVMGGGVHAGTGTPQAAIGTACIMGGCTVMFLRD